MSSCASVIDALIVTYLSHDHRTSTQCSTSIGGFNDPLVHSNRSRARNGWAVVPKARNGGPDTSKGLSSPRVGGGLGDEQEIVARSRTAPSGRLWNPTSALRVWPHGSLYVHMLVLRLTNTIGASGRVQLPIADLE